MQESNPLNPERGVILRDFIMLGLGIGQEIFLKLYRLRILVRGIFRILEYQPMKKSALHFSLDCTQAISMLKHLEYSIVKIHFSIALQPLHSSSPPPRKARCVSLWVLQLLPRSSAAHLQLCAHPRAPLLRSIMR
jgi:hypothetical protein